MDAKKFFLDIYGEEVLNSLNFRSDGDASYLILKLITNLDTKAEKIIRMLYGLDNGYPRNVKDIAKELSYPESYVSQLVDNSIAKLKEPSIIGPYVEKARKAKEALELKNKSVSNLGLPSNVSNTLLDRNIITVDDLLKYTYIDLLNLGGLTRKDIAHIYIKLMESFQLEAIIDKEAYNKLLQKISESR